MHSRLEVATTESRVTSGSLAWQFWVDGTVSTHFFRSILFVITTQYELSTSGNTTATTVHTIKDKISFGICQLSVWRSLK